MIYNNRKVFTIIDIKKIKWCYILQKWFYVVYNKRHENNKTWNPLKKCYSVQRGKWQLFWIWEVIFMPGFQGSRKKKKKGKLDGLHRFQMRVFPGERRGDGAGMWLRETWIVIRVRTDFWKQPAHKSKPALLVNTALYTVFLKKLTYV